MKSNEITILITYYNTKYDIFKETLTSVRTLQVKKNNNSQIIIIDDGSDKEYKENIYKLITELELSNTTIYHLEKNMNITTAIYNGLEKIKTKYTMRLDSDDIIYYVPVCDEDVDVILKYKTAETHEKWKIYEGNSHLPGIVMKTELYKKMYDNYEYFKQYERDIHEDTYYFQRFLLQNKKYTYCRTKNNHYVYRREYGNVAKEKTKSNKEINNDIITLLKKEKLY